MMKFIKKQLENPKISEIVRYLIVGSLTTFVSFSCYYLLYRTGLNYNIANFISIFSAILFAYVANKLFVFKTKSSSFKKLIYEFLKFLSTRLITMIIEMVGVFLLVDILDINKMYSKVAISILIVILNYIFSKILVFKNTDKKYIKE